MQINPITSVFKALGMSLVTAVLFFFVGNFLGIVGLLIYHWWAHTDPDFSNAYKYVGMPMALTALVVAFVVTMGMEVRKMKNS